MGSRCSPKNNLCQTWAKPRLVPTGIRVVRKPRESPSFPTEHQQGNHPPFALCLVLASVQLIFSKCRVDRSSVWPLASAQANSEEHAPAAYGKEEEEPTKPPCNSCEPPSEMSGYVRARARLQGHVCISCNPRV